MGHFVVGMLLPCLPLIEMLLTQCNEHRETIRNTRDLIAKLDPIIDTLCAKRMVTGLKTTTRNIQDEIFRHRKSCPFVRDWVYWQFRNGQEEEMKYSIERKVSGCLSTCK